MWPLPLFCSLEGSLIPWCLKDVAAGAVYLQGFFGENKRETKEKGEATIKEGFSTQSKSSGMGFAVGNLWPWTRGDGNHC